MGKQTHYFRQSNKSLSGNNGARNFSQMMRTDGWHMKIWNKVRGKGELNGQS